MFTSVPRDSHVYREYRFLRFWVNYRLRHMLAGTKLEPDQTFIRKRLTGLVVDIQTRGKALGLDFPDCHDE